MSKKYRVLNPRNIPAGIPIIGFKDKQWMAGEVFTAPEGFDRDGRLLADGFIEEVE